MSNKTVKNIREPLKKPRPLKTATSVEQPKDLSSGKALTELLSELEMLNVSIGNCNFNDDLAADISHMCTLLKKHGEDLDAVHKDVMDRYFCTLRNVSREDCLDIVSRLKLLEIIELRSVYWKANENDSNYYNTRYSQIQEANEGRNQSGSVSPNAINNIQNQSFTNNASLAPGEFLRSSGKFSKPTKIAGKNYFKDEIVIRNCDSGKVNAGARDRLVQITGPHEEAISHAKYLVEDTIKRNVSPVRENLNMTEVDNKEHVDFGNSNYYDRSAPSNRRTLAHSYSLNDAPSCKDFSTTVPIGHDLITLTGTKVDLLETARLVLLEYFTELESSEQDSNIVSESKVNNNHQPNQRFALKKQASLKDNLCGPFSSVNHCYSRQSSSMSSSSDEILADEESGNLEAISPPVPAPIPPPSYPSHQSYSREFLLECARLPLSKVQPPDYETFTSAYPELRPQTPVMFNPSPYLQTQSAS